jgi:uncharacterized LabA/DUF88 family protein
LVDGGFLRHNAKKAGFKPDPDFIERVAHAAVAEDELLFRILYYDCAPYLGKVKRPVTGTDYQFTGSDHWLHVLAAKDYFAVRRGTIKFRGWKPINIPITPRPLTDADFEPSLEQKGVDMRIGLDMATLAANRAVHRIALVTGDTDFVPAMKYARTAGLQIVLVTVPGHYTSTDLLRHCDFRRPIEWP